MVANPMSSHSPIMGTNSEHESAIPTGCSSCRQLHADIQIFVHQITDQITDKLDRLALRVEELFLAQKQQNYVPLNNNNGYSQILFSEFAKQRQWNNNHSTTINNRKSSSNNQCNLAAFEQAIKSSFIGDATMPNSPKHTNGKKRGSIQNMASTFTFELLLLLYIKNL